LKILYAASPCLSQSISAQFALEICLAARNRQKINNNPFWRLRSSKVIEFGGNREPVYDFLLVIYSNLGPLLGYGDLLAKNRKFFIPPQLVLLLGMAPFEFIEKLYGS